LLYHVCAVASRNIRFASCGTGGKLTLWTCLVRIIIVKVLADFLRLFRILYPNDHK
jgi:hypothetical protein